MSTFIIRIGALWDMNCFPNLRLRQITVFPQISNPLVSFHYYHHLQYSSEQFVLLTF